MVLIFIISGLTLKTDDVRAAFRVWKAPLFGVISILFVTPTLALLPAQLHFLQKDFQVTLGGCRRRSGGKREKKTRGLMVGACGASGR